VLVTLGVTVWIVWLGFALLGRPFSLLAAVVLHLAFVVPGGVLIRRARSAAGEPVPRGRRLGNILIGVGVLAWVPYLYITESLHEEVPVAPFLVWHLAGVIPGALLRYTKLGSR
jgi:hypothetical protein